MLFGLLILVLSTPEARNHKQLLEHTHTHTHTHTHIYIYITSQEFRLQGGNHPLLVQCCFVWSKITDLYVYLFFIFQRGNKSDNFHCDECNVCLSTSLKENHKCFTNRGHDPCAICLEASDPSNYFLYLVTHPFIQLLSFRLNHPSVNVFFCPSIHLFMHSSPIHPSLYPSFHNPPPIHPTTPPSLYPSFHILNPPCLLFVVTLNQI